MLREKNILLDYQSFKEEMDIQKQRAKAAWRGSGDKALHGDFKKALELFGKNNFVGYTRKNITTKILAFLMKSLK